MLKSKNYFIFSFAVSLFLFSNSFGFTISGYVFHDKNGNGIKDLSEVGLKEVSVSNQFSVVQTNSEGYFQITNQTGFDFVFINVPNGYASNKQWWQKIPDDGTSLDFPLSISPTKSTFTFIHASDTHISENSIDRMQKLREIVENTKVDFVLITGDLVKDALRVPEKEALRYYNLYVNEIQKFSVPVWSVPGNHEIFGIERHLSLVSKDHPLYGKKMYKHFLGPNYYSFNFGGFHFIALDVIDFEDLWYFGHVDSTQFNWLKQDLANVSSTTPVITFNHMAFFSGGLSTTNFIDSGPSRTLEIENGVNQFRHVVSNAREVVDQIQTHPFPIALSGHYHIRQVYWIETDGQKTRFEQTAAVIGPGNKQGNLVTPSGVTLYSIKNGIVDEGKFIRLDK